MENKWNPSEAKDILTDTFYGLSNGLVVLKTAEDAK
jgi:hypothetical protein